MTYNEAQAELEKILASLRSETFDVDTLAQQTRRAADLLTECRSRLTRTEQELAQVLEQLEADTQN